MSDPAHVGVDIRLVAPDDPTPAQLLGDPWKVGGVRLDLSAVLTLPGVHGEVDRFGVEAFLVVHPKGDGDLLGGFFALAGPDAHEPEAIGLALAGPLPGGGRLEHVGSAYRGAIGVDLGAVVIAGFASLELDEPISVVAVLSATFRPPIQLSFGFTLVGVGGTVGVNRRVDREGIAAALSSGALGELFFPRDPVGDAGSILPALDRSFPVSSGDFFVGPMLKLGWGTPTIASGTLAVIAGSTGVVIVGSLRLSLPCEDVPFAQFNVTVVGLIDATGVSIDGSLVNSHVGPVTVDGDARFRLTGDTMALSVGGFHPQYTPPQGMSGMKRLRAELSTNPLTTMRLEGYTALTSDCVQFGGSVEIRADVGVAAIDGGASFDAIIYFSPFRFSAAFRAHLAAEVLGERVAGISVTATFAGPGHWELVGQFSVEVLWWDVDVPVELSWGDPLLDPVSTERAEELVAGQLELATSWTADLHQGARMVILAEGVDQQQGVLSPLGLLVGTQMAAPLEIELTRLGGRRLAEPVTVHIDPAGVAATPADRGFPDGLFFERDVDLSHPSALVQRQAGVTLGDGTPRFLEHLTKDLDFEDAILDPDGTLTRLKASPVLLEHAELLVAAGIAARRRDFSEPPVVAAAFAVIGAEHG
jgi:hypothetical protein